MHELCMVDGFVDIANNLADMIKYLANEPSVGLFYIQQHTHSAVPNLVNLNKKVVEKSHEATLHMEDLEDSVTMTRSMKEFGFPIAEEMIKDIKHSLAVVATNQPRKGLINIPGSSFGIGRSASTRSILEEQDGDDDNGGYLSNVIKSARRKASSFKWTHNQGASSEPSSSSLNQAVAETYSNELRVADDEELPHESKVNRSLSCDRLLSLSSNYEEFRATREAELEEWLEGGTGDECNM